jgi:hypothetical protein
MLVRLADMSLDALLFCPAVRGADRCCAAVAVFPGELELLTEGAATLT